MTLTKIFLNVIFSVELVHGKNTHIKILATKHVDICVSSPTYYYLQPLLKDCHKVSPPRYQYVVRGRHVLERRRAAAARPYRCGVTVDNDCLPVLFPSDNINNERLRKQNISLIVMYNKSGAIIPDGLVRANFIS